MPIKSRYLFVASMDVDPDKEALFNEVYDTEHVPNLVKVPGAQAVARMEGEPFAMSIGGEEKQVGRNQAGARHIVGVPVVGQEIERRRMGRRGARVRLPLVIDLKVPANAEIVIEGYLGLDPATYEIEGPFAEVTGYVAATARRNRQSASPASPTATIRSCAERSKARCPAVSPRTACARRSCAPRRPGTCSTGPGCRASPTCGARQCKRASIFLCRSNKPIAAKPSRWPMRCGAALPGMCATSTSPWSTTTSTFTITAPSIGRSPIASNAGEDDIVIMPATFGLGLDPSTRKRDRNTTLYGTGKWNRVLIDATMNLDYDPDPEFDGARFPPLVRPAPEDIAAAKARWSELGLDKPRRK